MDLIIIILMAIVLFGGGMSYRQLGRRGGFGIGGLLLILVVIYLMFGHARF